MNTDIRSLQLLERDIERVAAREHERIAVERAKRATGGSSGGPRKPRRLPGRGAHWPAVAAVVVAFLVIAGGIGFLAQGGSSDNSAMPASLEQGAQASATTAPAAGAPDFESFAPGTQPGDQTRAADLSGSSDKILEQAGAGAAGSASEPQGALPDLPGQPQQDLSKIIRDGSITVVVADGEFPQKVTAVTRIANSNGGFVLTSSSKDGSSGTFTLRIPDHHFDRAMDQLRALGEVKADQVTGQDVTAEYMDLKARLDILTERRDLLRSLQAKATTSSEILRFAGLIDQVQFEIEKIQGQLNFIHDQVSEATIKVSLREQDAPAEESNSDTDNPSIARAWDLALQGFLRVLGAVVVGLGYLIPIGVIAVIGWLVVRLVRRRDRGAS
jgi:Domain of unknown function (DUF4349)